jgi:GxxExxY protein
MQHHYAQNQQSLTRKVLTAAQQVRRDLGPGLLNFVYQPALINELKKLGVRANQCTQTQRNSSIMVEDQLLLDLNCVDDFSPGHIHQFTHSMQAMRFREGLLINFNALFSMRGVKQVSI